MMLNIIVAGRSKNASVQKKPETPKRPVPIEN